MRFPDGIVKFWRQLWDKLERGAAEYGDASYQRSREELLGEIQEECIDIAGWAYVLWLKVEALKRAEEKSQEQRQADQQAPEVTDSTPEQG